MHKGINDKKKVNKLHIWTHGGKLCKCKQKVLFYLCTIEGSNISWITINMSSNIFFPCVNKHDIKQPAKSMYYDRSVENCILRHIHDNTAGRSVEIHFHPGHVCSYMYEGNTYLIWRLQYRNIFKSNLSFVKNYG